jgi:hypothetical protein
METNNGINALARAKYEEKVRRGIFKPVARLLHVDVEDRMQEGQGMGYEQYLAKAQKDGTWMEDALCVHVVKRRATDFARHLVRGGGQKKRDAMDVRNYLQGRTEVLDIDGLVDEEGGFQREGDRDLCLEVGLAEKTSRNPVGRLNSALDLESWLSSLEPQDRQLLSLRFEGFTLEESAATVGLSVSTVFTKLKALGRELADRAGLAIVKKPRKPRTDRRATTEPTAPQVELMAS